MSYNERIEPGSTITDIGFIISTESPPDIQVIRVCEKTGTNGSDSTETAQASGKANDTTQTDPIDRPEPIQGDDYLTTDGNKIIDQNGDEIWITGINWFGYNTGTNIFDGVWACNMEDALESIANRGFNLLRIPISSELILEWKEGIYPDANYNQALNSELIGMNSLEILDYAVAICSENGIKIMFDIHSAQTDAMGHMTNLWYTDRISAEQFYESLQFLATHYLHDDTVIAIDLKNEPHGKPHEVGAIWNDSEDPNNWKHVAETAGNLVLDINPHLLILIEGIEIYPKDLSKNADYSSGDSADYHFCWWGGNLRGVRDYPIDFGTPERNAQIIYSPHDYGPDVYQQPWFSGEFTYESLQKDCWNDNWLFIHREGIAPLLIGEWGGFMREPNLTWMTYLRQLIAEEGIHHTFWCYNANSGDTGGLVEHDFITWDEDKYEFVREVLWEEGGYFVGLDHEVPLGKAGYGISLKSAVVPVVSPVDPPSDETLVNDATKTPSVSTNSDISGESSADTILPSDYHNSMSDESTRSRKCIGAGIAIVICFSLLASVYFFKRIKRD
ncbi:MAG: glycoside hydrolase family 5 protein [Clostridiales bacterium]|nr:glycoside hydrolase family 5 protein [Clostridiales bacterium]